MLLGLKRLPLPYPRIYTHEVLSVLAFLPLRRHCMQSLGRAEEMVF